MCPPNCPSLNHFNFVYIFFFVHTIYWVRGWTNTATVNFKLAGAQVIYVKDPKLTNIRPCICKGHWATFRVLSTTFSFLSKECLHREGHHRWRSLCLRAGLSIFNNVCASIMIIHNVCATIGLGPNVNSQTTIDCYIYTNCIYCSPASKLSVSRPTSIHREYRPALKSEEESRPMTTSVHNVRFHRRIENRASRPTSIFWIYKRTT